MKDKPKLPRKLKKKLYGTKSINRRKLKEFKRLFYSAYAKCIPEHILSNYIRNGIKPPFSYSAYYARWFDAAVSPMRDKIIQKLYSDFEGFNSVTKPKVPHLDPLDHFSSKRN